MNKYNQAQDILNHAFELWRLIDDPDLESSIEMLLGKLLFPESDPEVQEWAARRLIGGMCI